MNEDLLHEEQSKLPNDTLTLVFGILSIVLALCCPPIGLVLGILAFVWGNKGKAMFYEHPERWLDASFSNIKIGRILGIIGAILGLVVLIYNLAMLPEIMEQVQEVLDELEQQ
jgi:hypothetical protein